MRGKDIKENEREGGREDEEEVEEVVRRREA